MIEQSELDQLFDFGHVRLSPALSLADRLRAEQFAARARTERHREIMAAFRDEAERTAAFAADVAVCKRWFGDALAWHMADSVQRRVTQLLVVRSGG